MSLLLKCNKCGRKGGYAKKDTDKNCARCNKSKSKSSKTPGKGKK